MRELDDITARRLLKCQKDLARITAQMDEPWKEWWRDRWTLVSGFISDRRCDDYVFECLDEFERLIAA
jgi:hypothetical protein